MTAKHTYRRTKNENEMKTDEIRTTMKNLAFAMACSHSHRIQNPSHGAAAIAVDDDAAAAARLIGVNYKSMICVI